MKKKCGNILIKVMSFIKKNKLEPFILWLSLKRKLEKYKKKIRRKQKTFSGLAKEYSLGPEGIQGGDLGYFEAGQMPEEFDDVFKLKINKISDIIRTPYGFHLFKVVGKSSRKKNGF